MSVPRVSRRKNGFTVVELILVAVLGSLIVLAVYQALVTNVRTYSVQAARVKANQAIRSGTDILAMEFRELSPSQDDIQSMSSSGLTVRSAHRFGLVCGVNLASTPQLTVRKYGQWFETSDTVAVFADNNVSTPADDDWVVPAVVTAVDTTQACNGNAAQLLSFAGQSAPFTADSVRVGAIIRAFTTRSYKVGTFDGDMYLLRTDKSGTTPLVGPLDSDGLKLSYYDADGSVTGDRLDVAQIVFQLSKEGEVTSFSGQTVSSARRIRVYPRN